MMVHDTGVVGQVAFIDMEYLEGQTLRELLKPGKPIRSPRHQVVAEGGL